MGKIRDPELITEEIRDLENIIISTKELLKQYPTDSALILTLEQAEFRKDNLIKELQESLSYNHRHVIKFVFDATMKSINLDVLLSNLENFKKLIDKTLEIIFRKKRNKIDLYFNTVFSGSLGILLSTPFDDKLFDSDYENVFEFVFSTLNEIAIESEDKIHSIVQSKLRGNRKLIRKYTNFFESIINSLNSVQLIWSTPNKKEFKVAIRHERAKKLYSLFKEQEKHEEEIVDVIGFVKGISLIRYHIEFIENDKKKKEIIRAKFDKRLTDTVKDSFDVLSKATFKVKVEFNEITEEEKRIWELIEIQKLI